MRRDMRSEDRLDGGGGGRNLTGCSSRVMAREHVSTRQTHQYQSRPDRGVDEVLPDGAGDAGSRRELRRQRAVRARGGRRSHRLGDHRLQRDGKPAEGDADGQGHLIGVALKVT